jgi:hypothetical protein
MNTFIVDPFLVSAPFLAEIYVQSVAAIFARKILVFMLTPERSTLRRSDKLFG